MLLRQLSIHTVDDEDCVILAKLVQNLKNKASWLIPQGLFQKRENVPKVPLCSLQPYKELC